MRFARQRDNLAPQPLLVSRCKILHQNSPRHSVHDKVMDRNQQMVTTARPEQSKLHQRTGFQIHPLLDQRCLLLDRRADVRFLRDVEYVQAERLVFRPPVHLYDLP
ncbi:hypothetical protein D3C73_938700 [compost metagenome]